MDSSPSTPWRSTAAYLYLLEADPLALAWEYLRRNPRHQIESQKPLEHDPKPWPLEKGAAVREDLPHLGNILSFAASAASSHPSRNLDFCRRPAFIEGVRTLKAFDLTFDLGIDHRQMANLLKFVEQVREVSIVLDHMGKPAIKDRVMHPWAEQLRELTRFQNVWCKISGLATEADHQHWTPDQLRPYIDVALDAFGFERVMFGGDWPVSTLAIGYAQWIELLEKSCSALASVNEINSGAAMLRSSINSRDP